jgi:NhaP-type Na+/H+ and K+/H+ antiporter
MVQRLRTLARNRRFVVGAQLAALVVLLGFLAWAVRDVWPEAAPRLRDADPVDLGLALLVLAAYYLVFVIGWMLILASMGIRVPYSVALQAEMLSMLAKYVPGGVWTPAARVVAMRRFGFEETPALIASILLEAGLSAVAGVLVFLARPVAVAACILPFGFSLREVGFVAWGGLKGSLPIILATYPLLSGLEGAASLFDVVFFVVLVSAVTQGWTLPYAARVLGLQQGGVPHSGVTLEITSLQDVDGDIVEYPILEGSRASGLRVRDLALPDGVVIAMIVRDKQVIPPRGSTKILPGDDVFVLLRPSVRALVEHVFAPTGAEDWFPATAVEFPLRGTTRLGEVEEFYGIHIDAPVEQTLDQFLRAKLGGQPAVGDRLASPPMTFTIRELSDDRIETVGLIIDSPES